MNQPAKEQPSVLELVVCPECDAAVGAGLPRCWLCGHAMDSPFKGTAGPPVLAQAADASRETAVNVALAACAAVSLLIVVGVWMQEPFYGAALAIVLVPALGFTLLSGLVARLSGKPYTPVKRLAVFAMSLAVTFSVAAVTAAVAVVVAAIVLVAMVIALFQACFKMLGG